MTTAAPFLVEPRRMSMSFMRAAESCLRRAEMERHVNRSGPDATIGRLFHCGIAAVGFACSMRGIERPDPEWALRVAKRAMAGPEERDPMPMAAWEAAVDLLARTLTSPSTWFHAGEQFEIDSRIAFNGRTLSARIDRLAIDGRFGHVRDWKTGWADPPDAADEIPAQGRRYAWHALRDHPELDEIHYSQHHVRFGIDAGPWVISRDELPAIEEYLRAQIDKITDAYSRGRLPATPGTGCSSPSRCPVAGTCPVPSWARPETTIESDDVALAKLDELLVLDARRGGITAAIRGHLENTGRRALRTGDQEIGFGTRTGRKLNRKRLAADLAARETGIDLAAYEDETKPTFGLRRAA